MALHLFRSTYGKDGEVLKIRYRPVSHPAWTGGKFKILDSDGQAVYPKVFQNLNFKK